MPDNRTTARDFQPASGPFRQLEIEYDARRRAVWYFLAPRGLPCFNPELLAELRVFQDRVRDLVGQAMAAGRPSPVQYTVLASRVPGIFNTGGDLQLFLGLIRHRDRAGLLAYATACIDVLYPNAVGLDLPITTISLVQGDALGGGFEAAVSSHHVIGEEGVRWGLPEVLFNLIPGMGAYSFLIRRTRPDVAEGLIMSGTIVTSQEMLEKRIIHQVAPRGGGAQAVLDFLDRHRRRHNAELAMARVRRAVNPVTYAELMDITGIWVEAALRLGDRDLRLIEKLIRAQDRRTLQPAAEPPAARKAQG